jgi:hypothetical protein
MSILIYVGRFSNGEFLYFGDDLFFSSKNYNSGISSSVFFSKGMSDMGVEGSISVFGWFNYYCSYVYF